MGSGPARSALRRGLGLAVRCLVLASSWRRRPWRSPGWPRSRLDGRDAGPQDLRQVGGLLLGLGQVQAGRADDVVALDLGLDDGLERLAVGVAVLVGLEVLGHRVDERRGHLQLLRPDLDVLVQEGEVGLAHLVGPQQGLQRDDPLPDPQRGQRLALAQRDLGHRHLPRRLQGVAEQHVRPGARPARVRCSSSWPRRWARPGRLGAKCSTSIRWAVTSGRSARSSSVSTTMSPVGSS